MRKSYTLFQALSELNHWTGFGRLRKWAKQLRDYKHLEPEELVLAILREYKKGDPNRRKVPESWLLEYGKLSYDIVVSELKERLATGQYTAKGFQDGSLAKQVIPAELWPSLEIDLATSQAINKVSGHAISGLTIEPKKQSSSITLNSSESADKQNPSSKRRGA